MELDGDEKRIQALFSELSVADQIRVPQFGHMWTRAQVSKESRGMGRPVAVLVSLLLTAAACSLAVWTWYRSAEAPILAVQLPAEATYTPTPILVDPATRDSRRPKHIARRRQVDRSISTEVTLLLSWQSPTQQFMASPTNLALGSLPALNQSAKDLESFLSKNSEIMKESNR